jgi:hypothetical protein
VASVHYKLAINQRQRTKICYFHKEPKFAISRVWEPQIRA